MEWPASVSALILAPFVGSFLGVVATRAAAPRTIVVGRSRCDSCGHALGPLDLIPVLSWLVLRGCCRHCFRSVSLFYPAVEAAAFGIAAWAALLADGWLVWASCLLGWTLLALAVIDIRDYVLPDFLTLPLAAMGLLAAGCFDPPAVPARLAGAVAGFLVIVALREAYWLLRRREGIGLGDAKLLAAAGAWVSWNGLASVVFVSAFVGLAIAVLRYARGGGMSLSDRVPFGAFLCLGTWVVWLYGPLV